MFNVKIEGSGSRQLANPLRVLPITLVISGPFIWSVNNSLSKLLDINEPKEDLFFDKNGRKIFSDYWMPIIKEKLNINVEPLD